MNILRMNFINKTKEIFDEFGVTIDAEDYFNKNFFNKYIEQRTEIIL